MLNHLTHRFWILLLLVSLALCHAGAQADRLGDAEYALKLGNYSTALEIFTDLANNNNPDAMIGLGRMYQAGHGVSKDQQTALQWFSKGINIWNQQVREDNPRAYASLGVLFEKGIAYAQDKGKARRYFKTAFELASKKAAQGHNDSQHLVGMLYSSGRGTRKDIHAGAWWLAVAGEDGNETAIKMLIHIYDCGCRGLPKDEIKTRYWRTRLANLHKSADSSGVN